MVWEDRGQILNLTHTHFSSFLHFSLSLSLKHTHTQNRVWWKNKKSAKLGKPRKLQLLLFESMLMGFMISFTSAMPVLSSKPKNCNFITTFFVLFFFSSLYPSSCSSFFISKEHAFMVLSSTPSFVAFWVGWCMFMD